MRGCSRPSGASIGISYARVASDGSAGAITADRILQDADAAMYRAKGQGKDRVQVFDDVLRSDPTEVAHATATVTPGR